MKALSFATFCLLLCGATLAAEPEPAAEPATASTPTPASDPATASDPAPATASDPAPANAAVDYLRDVKPILLAHCARCHGADEQNSGLRLDSAAGALEGGYSGPAVVAGDPQSSLLLDAVTGTGDITRMPPEEEADPLSDVAIDTLRRWIAAGAEVPADETAPEATVSSDHWAFQPLTQPVVPAAEPAAWLSNPIDAFVLQRLASAGLAPSPPAPRELLMRRVYLDLVGLLPQVEEVEAFVRDERPDAYEQLVDRLLASPHYGERWGRHWLDGARYADSNGYTIDGPRSIWKYRDWVIDALNRDLPFDQFVIEQLAGDLLDEPGTAQLVATGFHRNTLLNEEGGTDKEQFRVDAVFDRVDTTGAVFLGLTIGCARCHDHKYEPISQRDYYRLFAFFNSTDEQHTAAPVLDVPSAAQQAARRAWRAQLAELEERLASHEAVFRAGQDAWEAGLTDGAEPLSVDLLAILDVPPSYRNEAERQQLTKAYQKTDRVGEKLRSALEEHRQARPAVDTTMIIREQREPRTTALLIRGDFLRPGPELTPGVPAVLPPLSEHAQRANRLDLARWLVAPENPLTARVAVNRVWQRHFGRGLVETENDLGTQGAPPSHPELLDWLAWNFAGPQRWSTKALHRLIVTSSTYRQSSHARPDAAEIDPANALLARQARIRLEAEVIRDVALAAGGLLSPKVGGPSVFPPQPAGVMHLAQVNRAWQTSPGEDRYRRGMYTYFWRSTPHPFLKTFDAPEGNVACTHRSRTNTPLQSLTLLNDEAFYECAEALARRMLAHDTHQPYAAGAPGDAERIEFGFRTCLSRAPTSYERTRLLELLSAERTAAGRPLAEASTVRAVETTHDTDLQLAAVDASAAAGSADFPVAGVAPVAAVASEASTGADAADTSDTPEASDDPLTGWIAVARVLLNLDAFFTRE